MNHNGTCARVAEEEADACSIRRCVIRLPKIPYPRCAMVSPTARAIVSATALSRVLPLVFARCSKFASSSLSCTLRMRSSHISVSERLSIISLAVMRCYLLVKTHRPVDRTVQVSEGGVQASRKTSRREELIEPQDEKAVEKKVELAAKPTFRPSPLPGTRRS